MSCCCNNILNLCKVNVCGGEIKTGVNADSSGEYKLVTDFLGVGYEITSEIVEGEEIKFPADKLNEKYKFTAKVLDPAGQTVTITKDEIEYNCISFETFMSYEITG